MAVSLEIFARRLILRDNFTVNGANIVGTFHQGRNNQGYYVIDQVLFPEGEAGQAGGQGQNGGGQGGQAGGQGGQAGSRAGGGQGGQRA